MTIPGEGEAWLDTDSALMVLALVEAAEAAGRGESPIGAVVSDPWGRPIAQGGNRTLADHDATAHAEIVALRLAARRRGDHRLVDCRLHVTLQPCPMCLEAIRQARITAVDYASPRLLEHAPLPESVLRQQDDYSHVAGVLLSRFFRNRRLP